jgi:hypothetical protein
VTRDINGTREQRREDPVAENFEGRREPGDGGHVLDHVLGRPTVAAWAVVAVLILIVFIGFGSLRGRAHARVAAATGARIVNPIHDALCPDLRVTALDNCQAQRSSEPEDRANQLSAP